MAVVEFELTPAIIWALLDVELFRAAVGCTVGLACAASPLLLSIVSGAVGPLTSCATDDAARGRGGKSPPSRLGVESAAQEELGWLDERDELSRWRVTSFETYEFAVDAREELLFCMFRTPRGD